MQYSAGSCIEKKAIHFQSLTELLADQRLGRVLDRKPGWSVKCTASPTRPTDETKESVH